jgi:uncharacterized membrane protein YkoI
MKKIFAIMLSLIFAVSLSACGFGSDNNADSKSRSNIMSDSIISSQMSDTIDSNTTETLITRDRAIELALKEAGLKREDVYDLEADLDREQNGTYWEVDFDSGNYEYSYDIDAKTEKIANSHREPRD